MNCRELCEKINGKLVSGSEDKELEGCFIGDLLSICMSKVQENNAWITIQSNINTVAVATLTEAGCIVMCEGFLPDENTLKKAKEENVSIIVSELSAYDIAKKI